MGFARVHEIILDTISQLVSAGASRETIALHIKPLEHAAVQSIIDIQRDQLLLNLEFKTADLAIRWGLSDRQVRNLRKSAIDRKSISAMSSDKAA